MLNDRFARWFMRSVPDFGLSRINGMPITLGTDIGLARKENQDRLATLRVNTNSSTSHPFLAVALADGMGGMCNGSECAARAVGAFFNALIRFRQKPPEDRLFSATNEANDAVHEFSKGNGGATLSAVLFDADHKVLTVNVGDSRIYAAQGNGTEDKKVVRLTVDDSLEEVVGGHGKELLQFIGMGEGLLPHISVTPENSKKIVITSDGAHFFSQSLLTDILIHADNQHDTVEQLLNVAKWRGGPDNASAAAILTDRIFESFTHNQESGIEVWDPFGLLHIMWLKHDLIEAKESNPTPSFPVELCAHKPENLALNPSPSNIQVLNQINKPKNSKKSKPAKKSKQPSRDQDPQMTIEIGLPKNTSTKEGIDDGNS